MLADQLFSLDYFHGSTTAFGYYFSDFQRSLDQDVTPLAASAFSAVFEAMSIGNDLNYDGQSYSA